MILFCSQSGKKKQTKSEEGNIKTAKGKEEKN